MTTTEFQSNIEAIKAKLFGLSMKLIRNYTEAEDLLQESISKAYTKRHTFKDGTNFNAWMSTIIYNDFVNIYRKKKRRNQVVMDREDWMPVLINKVDRENNADGSLLYQELLALVAELADNLKVPFLMSYRGYPYQEIADELGLAIGTIKNRIFYARKELRAKIKANYGGYPLKEAA